jgi:hypothetical protein
VFILELDKEKKEFCSIMEVSVKINREVEIEAIKTFID